MAGILAYLTVPISLTRIQRRSSLRSRNSVQEIRRARRRWPNRLSKWEASMFKRMLLDGRLACLLLGLSALFFPATSHGKKVPRSKAIASKKAWGTFSGPVKATWLDDEDKNSRKMRLLADFSYTDPQGHIWLAPNGSIIDGASIPQFFWSAVGGPFEGSYRRASVVHDVACQKRSSPWQSVHRMFYFAMLAGGVAESKAELMYAAVYHFGPRWTVDGVITGGPPKVGCPTCMVMVDPFARMAQDDAWKELQGKIQSGQMHIEDIEGYSFPEPLWIKPTDAEAVKRLHEITNPNGAKQQ